MDDKLKDAIVNGSASAAFLIMKSLVTSGAIEYRESILLQLTSIITKSVMVKVEELDAEKK